MLDQNGAGPSVERGAEDRIETEYVKRHGAGRAVFGHGKRVIPAE